MENNCHVEKIWDNLGNFGEIMGNFGRFCHNLLAFMWRKIVPKKYICGEKITNMRSGSLLLREREYHHLLPVNCPFSLSAWSACTFKDHFMPHLCLDISLKRMGNRCYLGKCPFCNSAQWRGAFLSSPNLHWIVSLGIIFILPSCLGKDNMSGDSTCEGR